MKFVASVIIHNEVGRFLRPFFDHLLEFVDEVRVLDDGSTDDFREIGWYDDERIAILRNDHSVFYEHEGKARQALLDWTMQGDPSVVLAIDADEFVDDGQALRKAVGRANPSGVWQLEMEEVWKADDRNLMIRQDGGWKQHPVGIVYWVPENYDRNRNIRRNWVIPDRALACGRVPHLIGANRVIIDSSASLLHFGWACEADRDERYQRYVTHDGGRQHAGPHLLSIMDDDSKVQLTRRKWPRGLDKDTLLERING
jgi:glycosyltransferase involved in cell wall biosynthesis